MLFFVYTYLSIDDCFARFRFHLQIFNAEQEVALKRYLLRAVAMYHGL